MKKFDFGTKRAKKVLALALAAALIVPSVPSGQVSADVEHWIDMPEAVATYDFDSADELVAIGTTGTAIKFTGDAIKATLESVKTDASGNAIKFQSTDKTPVMDGDEYVMEDIDVTPEIVEDEERGEVLSLKANVEVPQYPAGATSAEDIKQEKASYKSAVKVANPFTASRDKLYDASKYTVANIYATGTEETRYTLTSNSDRFADYKNRYSAPVADTGVTVSFWVSLPFDSDDKAAVTNLVEFYNDETVLYSTDDLAKNWIAEQYVAAEAAGNADDADSPFYIGTVKEVTITALGKDITKYYGNTFVVGEKVKYLEDDYGMYAKWNPAIAEAAYAQSGTEGTGALKCWTVKTKDNVSNNQWITSPYNKKYIVVELGNGDYAQLQWSDTVYAEGDENANLEKFKSTDEFPKGTYTRWTEGSTGVLNLASNQQFYARDLNGTGIVKNETSTDFDAAKQMEKNTYAYVTADGTVDGSLMNVADDSDESWHYVTYTITNEWIQTYVDGVAVEPSKVTTWYGNTFNQGSGIYKPNSTYVTGGNMRSDWQKICNDDFGGSIYGQLFGTTVMDFITDENTELYIGGKTQATAEGTLIDSILFYDEAFNRAQVAAEYTERNVTNRDAYIDSAEEVVLYGDADGNGEIAAEDALAVLKHVAHMENAAFDEVAADVDGIEGIAAEDALAILKYVAHMIDKFPVEAE